MLLYSGVEIWNDMNLQAAGADYLYKYIIIDMYIYGAGFVHTSVRQFRVIGNTFVIYINVKMEIFITRVLCETAHPIILIILFKRKSTSWNRF